MAGKPKRMSLVKQLLRMHHNSKGCKAIARTLSVSKKTVKSYATKVKASRISIADLLALEDPELEAALLAGNPFAKEQPPPDKYIEGVLF